MTAPELLKQIKQVDACMRPLEPEDVAAWESIKDFVQVASTPPEAMRDEHGDLVLFVRREPDGRVTDILWTISQEERERYTIKALKSHIAELEKDAARYQTVLAMGYKDYQEKCATLDLKVRSFADYVQQYNKTIDSPTGDA